MHNTFYNHCSAYNYQDYDFYIPRIILALSAETGISIKPDETLIIFDEIQEAPNALKALKYFCENANEYHIVAAGSLLGVAMHQGTSFPVGKVNFIDLTPLSFFEFLKALGEEELLKLLQQNDFQMINLFNEKYKNYLKLYFLFLKAVVYVRQVF